MADFITLLTINVIIAILYKLICKPMKVSRTAKETAAQRDARKRREYDASFEAGRELVRRALGR